jgi:Calx-beta domain-containing protein
LLGSQSTATLTVNDDDAAGTVQFSLPTYTVSESGRRATITVIRTGGSASGVGVSYATSNGTATAGSDYTATAGTLTFAVNQTTKTFTIPVTNDTLVEGSETVNLTLSNPTGGAALGAQNTAELTISDND